MQTFLPYESFATSASVLDGPRLGKQRVETLQILRAIVVPTYGWQRHPAVGMWRGFVPALTAYGLAMTDAWRARGAADTVRPQLVEFAPEVDGVSQQALGAAGLLPPWLGDPALHESHRSRLLQKAPAFYGPLFPGTPDDLDPVWPAPAEPPPEALADGLWVLRVDAVDGWRAAGLLALPLVDARGRSGPAWRQQLAAFGTALTPGTRIAVLADDDAGVLHLAEVTGPPAALVRDGIDFLAVSATFSGRLARTSLAVPALLQNPRRLFPVPRPAASG